MGTATMGILIDNQQNSRRIDLEQIQKTAQVILNDLDCPEGELSILFVDDRRIQQLNREYRRKDRPTNVLAFPMREGDFAQVSKKLDIQTCMQQKIIAVYSC